MRMQLRVSQRCASHTIIIMFAIHAIMAIKKLIITIAILKKVEHYCEIYQAFLQDHDFAVGPRHLLVPIVLLAQCEIDKEGVSYSGVTQIGV